MPCARKLNRLAFVLGACLGWLALLWFVFAIVSSAARFHR